MNEHTTLNHRANGAAVAAITAYVKDQARVAAESLEHSDPVGPRHISALENFAQFVASKGIRDERIYVLNRIGGWWGDGHDFEPGPQVEKLFGMLGAQGSATPTPPPDTTLNELAAAAVDDLLDRTDAEKAALRGHVAQAEKLAEGAAAVSERAEKAEATADTLTAELEEANGTIASLREQITHLRAMNGEAGPPTRSPSQAKPRRVAVEAQTGVYEKEKADGEILYEIGWREDGKQKWLVVGPDLQEAVETRANTLKELEAVPA